VRSGRDQADSAKRLAINIDAAVREMRLSDGKHGTNYSQAMGHAGNIRLMLRITSRIAGDSGGGHEARMHDISVLHKV
jgi:hypothetical protein